MKNPYNIIWLMLVLLVAQACKQTDASSDPASQEKADASIGCHPIDAAPRTEADAVEVVAPGPGRSHHVPDDMVLIKGGSFAMGTKDGLAVEGPVHRVTLDSFWIERHEVTVAQFAQFVKATGYKTESEKAGWSGVFNVRDASWERVDRADWQHPEGPSSSADPNEPVTHVSWNDASVYARWANKRLPTEAEFEYAARGGLSGKRYAWGDDLIPNGKFMANWWQGVFPTGNLGEDGFIGRAPVGSFAPNGYGLYEITGNVWEWCSDWFDENYYSVSRPLNPKGPPVGEHRVIRGGSWLCSENYCTGYRVAARNHTAPDTGLNNLGFRCARDP